MGTLDWFLVGVVLALLRRPGTASAAGPVAVALSARVAWPAALVIAVLHVTVLDVRHDSCALIAAPDGRRTCCRR